jgi:ribosomal protein S18 acetylase RimI-like enzyme
MNFNLRPVFAGDQEFLYQLYADTRREEIALFGWPPAQQEAFLRMQFNAQRNWYETAYAGAEHRLILVDNEPAGRILVFRETKANRLVDISLLSVFRGKNIGTRLLRDLIHQSANEGLEVHLQVLKSNRARSLYERLAFTVTGEDEMYYRMENKGDSLSNG